MTHWHKSIDPEKASLVVQRLTKIRGENSDARKKWRTYSNMYLNTTNNDSSGQDDDFGNLTGREGSAGLAKNMIARCVDTIVTRLTMNKSRARFVTDNGNDVLQTRALDLTRYCDAVLGEQQFYSWFEKILRDGCLYGTGWLKVFPDIEEGLVKLQSVALSEIFISRLEAKRENPTEILHRYVGSRMELLSRYPEKQIEIEGVTPCTVMGESDDDAVIVVEAFKSEPWNDDKETSGRHVIVVGDCVTAKDEPWPYAVPFIPFHYKQHNTSCFGTGVCDLIAEKHLYINKVLKDIAKAAHRYGHAKLMVNTATIPEKGAFTDELDSIVNYTGDQPPKWSDPPNVSSQELFNLVESLSADCLDDVGTNELATGGKVPGSIKSGKGIQEANDVQSVRFASVSNNLDSMSVKTALAIIDCAKVVNKGTTKVSLKSYDGSITKKFWKDIDVKRDALACKPFSVAQLPLTPQARIDYVTDLQNMGFIGKSQAFDLMGALDTAALDSSEAAPLRAAQRYARLNLENEGTKLIMPEEFLDPTICLKAAVDAATELVGRDDPDQKKLTNIKNYIYALTVLVEPPKPEQVPPELAAPPPIAPEGNVAVALPSGQLPGAPGQVIV